MVGLEIAAIAKTTSELTKDHQKGFVNYILVSFFGPHYLRYLTRSLVLEGMAKTEAERQIANFGENPHPAIALIQSEAEIEYRNMFGVLEKAIPKLQEGKDEGSEIDPDKLKRLKDLSKDFSSDEMQEVIAGILAGEYNQSGSFTLKTMDSVKSLSKNDIELFRKFCGMTLDGDLFFVNCFNLGNPGNAITNQEGVGYTNFLYLQEIGLVGNRTMARQMGTKEDTTTEFIYNFQVQGEIISFKRKGGFTLNGLGSLTIAGRELLPILGIYKNVALMSLVKSEFMQQGFTE